MFWRICWLSVRLNCPLEQNVFGPVNRKSKVKRCQTKTSCYVTQNILTFEHCIRTADALTVVACNSGNLVIQVQHGFPLKKIG